MLLTVARVAIVIRLSLGELAARMFPAPSAVLLLVLLTVARGAMIISMLPACSTIKSSFFIFPSVLFWNVSPPPFFPPSIACYVVPVHAGAYSSFISIHDPSA